MARKGRGKSCGASYIANNKVCRVGMPSAVAKALNAAAGEIGAASLIEAVKKHAGNKGVARLREIRADVRGEMGGNIVRGPKADELKKRLQAEGLLPSGRAKGAEPEAPKGLASIFNKNMRPAPEAPKSVPTDLKKELAALAARDHQAENPKTVEKPDTLYGSWSTQKLKDRRDFLSLNEEEYPELLARAEKELARRANGGKPAAAAPKAASEKPDSVYGAWPTDDLEMHRGILNWMRASQDKRDRVDAELEKRVDSGRTERIAAREKAVQALQKASTKLPTDSATGNTRYAKEEAADFDKNFKPASRQGGTYDWSETSKSGTKKIGQGSFGTVLLTKGPPPVAVKRGEVSANEAKIIAKVGKADLGPRLIAGETAKGGQTEYGVLLKQGRIAMSVVPGKELRDMKSGTKIGNTTAGDAYWEARAALHRLGIAHNDMHPGNLLIDETGKGRWVDMGLAHDHPGAALAEALGVLRKPLGSVGVGEGDWQGQRWAAQTGNSDTRLTSFAPENLKRMQSNHDTKVLPFLRSKGLTDDEIGVVMTNGIRRPPSEYTTIKGFNKLNDDDALQAINLLYDGI